MFVINEDNSIYATRGDIVFFSVSADDDGNPHHFQAGDVVRFKVYGKKDAETVVLQKDFPVTEVCEEVEIFLGEEDTKIGEVISKPKDYWYEVELNPFDHPQTIIGYDEDGAKVFKLFPEGDDVAEFVPEPRSIAMLDEELDMTSTRPVQNQAIARAYQHLLDGYERTHAAVAERFVTPEMFGAIGDGEADDTEAFVKALAEGTVVGSVGKRYYVANLSVNESTIKDCRFVGADYTENCILLSSGGVVENCKFARYKNAITTDGGNNLVFSKVRDCLFEYNRNGIYLKLGTSQSINQTIIENCYFVKNGENVDDMNSTYTDGVGYGVYIDGNFCNICIHKNVFEYNSFSGIALVNTSTAYRVGCDVGGNYFEGNKNCAIYLETTNSQHQIRVDGNYFSVSAVNVFGTNYISAPNGVYSCYIMRDVNDIIAHSAYTNPITHKVELTSAMTSVYMQIVPANPKYDYLRVCYTANLERDVILNSSSGSLTLTNGTHEGVTAGNNSFWLSRTLNEGESIVFHHFGS